MDIRSLTVAAGTIGLLAVSGPAGAQVSSKPSARDWMPTRAPQDEAMTPTGSNRYFILVPGYQLTLRGKEGDIAVDLVITVLRETKLVDGVETRVVEERETNDGQLIEVSRNYFAVGVQTRNVYYFGEDVDIYEKGKVTSHEGAWLAGEHGAMRGIAMPADGRVGDRYYQEQAPKVAMDRAETMSVTTTVNTPADTFDSCLKVRESTPLEVRSIGIKLYAPGVGLVQDGDLKLVKSGFVRKAAEPRPPTR